jgi:hypothetical protein
MLGIKREIIGRKRTQIGLLLSLLSYVISDRHSLSHQVLHSQGKFIPLEQLKRSSIIVTCRMAITSPYDERCKLYCGQNAPRKL